MRQTASGASKPLIRTTSTLFRAGVSRLIHHLQAGRRLGYRLLTTASSAKPPAKEDDDHQTISSSAFFDAAWYLETYPDVKAADADPATHYLSFGAGEGRNPSPHFDTKYYLETYPDVAQSGVNALVHYVQAGAAEGRLPSPPKVVQVNEDEYRIISASPLFDSNWYLAKYPHLRAIGIDPATHYLAEGASQGLDPSRYFSTSYYMSRYPDVREAGLNPLVHYLTHGEIERRQPSDPNSFDEVASGEWKARLREHVAAGHVAAGKSKVSIVMPTKDRRTRIGGAIESVRRQTYPHWELIVVDDHSSDETIELLRREFGNDDRIAIVVNDGHGVGDARNTGLDRATGSFIAYLDSDNRWYEDYLELMIRAIESDGSDCGYAVQKCYRNPFLEEKSSIFYRNNVFDYEHLKLYNYIDLNIFVHRSSLVPKLGRFDTSLRRMVDWDLVLRYCKDRHVTKAEFIGVKYDAGPSADRISNKENRSYLYAVRNKHLVDWHRLTADIEVRDTDLISIVMCVYGQAHLTNECLKSLYLHEAGERFELILVDNASDDETRALLIDWTDRHANIKVIRNPENFNFALGNNIGFAATVGSRVVFLNNDTLVSPEWLRALVNPLRDPAIKGTQAKLVYPDGRIQCVGVVFSELSALGYPIYADQPGNFALTSTPRNYRAVTAAAFAIRALDFAQARGFDPIFVNGQEDIDLCLRLGSGKPVFSYVPDAVVIHHESKTPGRGRHVEGNRAEFIRRWSGKFKADDLGYYEADGYQPEEYEPDTLDRAENGLAVWRPGSFRDISSADSGFATEFQHTTIAIKIGCPHKEMKDRWGDYHFAVALAAAFHRRGVKARIDFLPFWQTGAEDGDINLVLRGLSRFEPTAGSINVMWMISHPDKVPGEELDRYDHVFVASTHWAAELAKGGGVPVEPLLQCTDPGRFNVAAYDKGVHSKALFVANSRKVLRPIVREAEAQGVELDIYGEMWEGLAPQEWIKGENIPNVDLPKYYAGADVVLNDHWPSMRECGFVSNRVFDVLACGGKLVTDSVVGMPPEIEKACQFFDRKKSLASLVAASPPRTGRIGKKARAAAEMVHRHHSFDARVEVILSRLSQLLSRRPADE